MNASNHGIMCLCDYTLLSYAYAPADNDIFGMIAIKLTQYMLNRILKLFYSWKFSHFLLRFQFIDGARGLTIAVMASYLLPYFT